MRKLLDAHLVATYLFLYVPIFVMAALAFNSSPLYKLPFHFDLIWFKMLAGNDRLLQAGWNSLYIAVLNTIIATALGTALVSSSSFQYSKSV